MYEVHVKGASSDVLQRAPDGTLFAECRLIVSEETEQNYHAGESEHEFRYSDTDREVFPEHVDKEVEQNATSQ